MRVDLFDFDLPENRIALRPASPRDAARLLVVKPGQGLEDRIVRDLPDLLQPGDALVFNDTKVIPAQLEGVRLREGASAAVGITLHMRLDSSRWKGFARGAKKLRAGDRLIFGHGGNACLAGVLDATVEERGEAGEVTLAFDLAGAALDAAMHEAGHIPLPPYIALKRPEDERDRSDYQTIYAREEGAVAAPTAGLHFTPELMERLTARGISQHFVTLHVGRGHLPAGEGGRYRRAQDACRARRRRRPDGASAQPRARGGGRIVCVGTTSLRLLESAADESGAIQPWDGATDIFITPGYRFRACDVLMTNFHLPRSTLFMLVSAFSGLETMRAAYAHAVASGYRFYSYGDASLLYRAS